MDITDLLERNKITIGRKTALVKCTLLQTGHQQHGRIAHVIPEIASAGHQSLPRIDLVEPDRVPLVLSIQ